MNPHNNPSFAVIVPMPFDGFPSSVFIPPLTVLLGQAGQGHLILHWHGQYGNRRLPGLDNLRIECPSVLECLSLFDEREDFS